MDRREFLGLLGLASGASLLAGCDLTRKTEKLIPYLVPPEDGVLPGEATFVATSCTECPAQCGMTARIRDGRPVKVDGLPKHPINDGALCVRGQSSLSRLYSVDRIRQPMVKDAGGNLVPATWADALKRSADALRAGRENVLLSGRTTGSLSALMSDFATRTGVRREPEFELFSYAAVRAANRAIFGADVVPLLHPDRADVVITVGADVVETFGNPVQFSTLLSKRRGSHGRNTWFHVEPHASMTGFQADHRFVVRPGSEAYLLAYLLQGLSGKVGLPGGVAAQIASVPAVSAQQAEEKTGLTTSQIDELRHALLVAESPLLVAGSVSTAQESGLDTARLAALIQSACGMHGKTLDFAQAQDYSRVGTMADVERLMGQLDAGTVGALILFDTDPVAQLPMGDKFGASIDKAAFAIGVSDMLTPTMERCDVVLPLSHTLESWGDAEPASGVVNAIQPAIAPLFDTRSNGDVLLSLMIELGAAAAGTTYQQYVYDRWTRDLGAGAGAAMLKQGWGTGPAKAAGGSAGAAGHTFTFAQSTAPSGQVLVIAPSVRWYDGRSAVLPLLQEVPDPLSAVTWDSWVSVGMETCKAMGIEESSVVELRGEGWSVPLTVRPQPGLAKDVFVVQRGAANPAVGWARSGGEANAVVAITAAATGRKERLSEVSGSLYQEGRGIVPGTHPEHFNGDHSGHGEPKHEEVSFYPLPKYPNYRWAMAVDLDKCIGCNACVAACYVENNIPMVGREQHLRGREMAWIRLEQYYEKDGSAGHFVPTMCQHCDFAPCEPVCPVYATYHNDEGLNAQVYNRCVGTRYCGNNCPYKQRRFNYFSYEHRPYPMNLMTNPDVSMRGKGMMEKCTMCVQRIRKARDVAKDEKRTIREGDLTTACAQACPGKAIVFGNLLDENSEVHKWAHDSRSNRILEELGTSPGVYYLSDNHVKGNGSHGA
ncbi:MAG TPA: 4Fe-4S dicluster domain-containing protein [Candidatus Krumholzibacteria bacterium]